MDNQQYEKLIEDTFKPDCPDHVLFCMVGLAGEAGEIANMAAKALRGDFTAQGLSNPSAFHEAGEGVRRAWEQREKLLGEMGGVFYYLHALCRELGVPPETVMAMNDQKLRSRLERGVIRGDGDER